jgi:hypothetical protein
MMQGGTLQNERKVIRYWKLEMNINLRTCIIGLPSLKPEEVVKQIQSKTVETNGATNEQKNLLVLCISIL